MIIRILASTIFLATFLLLAPHRPTLSGAAQDQPGSLLQGGNVIAEHDGTTGHNLADYISTGGRFLAKITSGGTVYFLRDWLSERLELDASGNVLGAMGTLPFGGDMAESGQQEKHHFTSYARLT